MKSYRHLGAFLHDFARYVLLAKCCSPSPFHVPVAVAISIPAAAAAAAHYGYQKWEKLQKDYKQSAQFLSLCEILKHIIYKCDQQQQQPVARTMTVAVAVAVAEPGLAQLWPCNKPGNNLQSQHNLLLLAKEAEAQAEVGSIQKIAKVRKKQCQSKTERGRERE